MRRITFVPTADICDDEEKHGCKHLHTIQLRDYGKKSRFAGIVSTVRCYEDNGMVSKALDEPGLGRVLIVDGGGSCARALFGDQMAAKVSLSSILRICHPLIHLRKLTISLEIDARNKQMQAMKNDWSGVIINGAVRDISQLQTMDLGVKALGTCPRKSNKRNTGERDVELEMFGVIIRPGMVAMADEDGVLILPAPDNKARL